MKQESHSRVCSVSPPARSVVSSTVLQKHVGQTSVQLPQLRQRSATSSQRGCSALACSRSRMSVTSSVAAHRRARSRGGGVGRVPLVALGVAVLERREHVGPALAADLDHEAVAVVVEELGQRQVEAAGDPRAGVHRQQKHVPPARPQLTATKKASRRRAS